MGEPLLCDFGLTRFVTASLQPDSSASIFQTDSAAAMNGSVPWMAPEIFDVNHGNKHTLETDVWAFGMTVYVRE